MRTIWTGCGVKSRLAGKPVDGTCGPATLHATALLTFQVAGLGVEPDSGADVAMPGQAPRACLERLRPAEPADQGECLRIWRETWPEAFSGRPLPPDEEFFRQTLGEEIFVVPGDRGLAGFVSLWLEEPFVHFLLVDGRYRRQGVGEALLRLAISRLPPPVHLKCAPGNAGALAFYARMGCTEVERVEAPGNAYVRLRLPEG